MAAIDIMWKSDLIITFKKKVTCLFWTILQDV